MGILLFGEFQFQLLLNSKKNLREAYNVGRNSGHRSTDVSHQGCQMAYFITKNPNRGKFWRVLQWKMLGYFMAFWSILRPYVIYSGHLADLIVIWYIFSRFGMLHQEKSGNPVSHLQCFLK
jgi:hypothetical protein